MKTLKVTSNLKFTFKQEEEPEEDETEVSANEEGPAEDTEGGEVSGDAAEE